MPASGAPNTTPASNASTVGSSFASIAPSTSALQPPSSSLELLAAAASISTVPVPGSTTTGAGATVSVSTSSSSNASPTLSSDLHDISLPTARSSFTLADSAAVSGTTAQKVLADSDMLHDSPSANDSRPTPSSALPILGSHDPVATSSTATIDAPPSSETAMMADTASMSAPTQHKDGANALSSPLSQTGHVQHHPRPETTQATADQTTAKGASTDSVTPALVIALTNIVIPTLTTQISATSKVSRIYRTSKNISLKYVLHILPVLCAQDGYQSSPQGCNRSEMEGGPPPRQDERIRSILHRTMQGYGSSTG
ncbi:hypothetical protein BC629DRAFT_6099 [Irpex lacteus]|nr:hypothetical protein BC629DRAFT_6099 [Irpex lacteus]